MTTAEKVRENRLRRMAERQGIVLVKSRARDPRSLRFGRYWMLEGKGAADDEQVLVYGGDGGYTLDEVERVLTWDVDVRHSVAKRGKRS